MRRVADILRPVLALMALLVSLALAPLETGEHAHAADLHHTDVHGHDEEPQDGSAPSTGHVGCHASVFCSGAVLGTARSQFASVSVTMGYVPATRHFLLSSAFLGFDPPPPRLS